MKMQIFKDKDNTEILKVQCNQNNSNLFKAGNAENNFSAFPADILPFA